MPSDCRYGATVPSRVAMLASSSTQLSAADISVRENSRVTNGPGAAAWSAEAPPARGACAEPLAADEAAGTSATAAATIAALSRPTRRIPTRPVSPVMVTTFLAGRLVAVADTHRAAPLRNETVRVSRPDDDGCGVRS